MNDHEAHLSQIMHEAAVAIERADRRIRELETQVRELQASLAVARERIRRMESGEL